MQVQTKIQFTGQTSPSHICVFHNVELQYKYNMQAQKHVFSEIHWGGKPIAQCGTALHCTLTHFQSISEKVDSAGGASLANRALPPIPPQTLLFV